MCGLIPDPLHPTLLIGSLPIVRLDSDFSTLVLPALVAL